MNTMPVPELIYVLANLVAAEPRLLDGPRQREELLWILMKIGGHQKHNQIQDSPSKAKSKQEMISKPVEIS